MAADQRRRRLNGVSVGDGSSLEQYGMKKRKLESSQNGLNSKSNISLKWDESRKKVVAKQEQIGISQRNSKPFTDSVLGSNNFLGGHLADAFSVPQETFELENLNEVLSYKVWQTRLSEEERNYLVQFLPSGESTEQVVEALLAGDNFHFGNPFLKWGASLCSGNFHPDAVLHKERSLKADKKAYYLELQKYHNDIIEYLLKLKERWGSCKDPEKEILPKIWRPRRDAEKWIVANAYESRLLDLEQDVTATSESCSWVADEKACSSDNQNSSVMKGELRKRNYEKDFMNDKSRNSLIVSEDVLNVGAKSRKRYELNKLNIHHNDGEQYMSYVKISRKQHELVKSMKQSGKSIQSRSMNRVLGNFKSLHVQPYEVFVEEEQKKKLHEHWLQLTTEDLPAFYVNWRERKKQLWEITQSLMQEMKAKLECRIEDKEKDNSGVPDEEEENSSVPDEEEENSGVPDEEEENSGVPEEEEENYGVLEEEEENIGVHIGVQDEEEENSGFQDEEEEDSGFQDEEEEDTGVQDEDEESTGAEDQEEENTGVLDEKKETTESPPQDQKENVATNHESPSQDQPENVATHHESNINDDEDSTHGENVTTNHESNIKNDEECAHGSPCDQSPEQITPLSGSHELNHLDVDPEKNHAAPKSDNSSSDVCENPWKMNSADDTVNQEVPFSSGGDVWQAISRPHSHYDCTAGHEFTTSGLALMNPQVNQDQQTQLIDMESDLREEYMRNDMLHRQPDNGSLSYQNQDRNDLLQSLFKGREMSYHQEQKQTGLHLQPPNNSMMAGDGQFPGHFQQHLESSLPLEQGRKRLNEFFLQQNTSDNDYSDRGRYLIPRQENLQLGNMHNWNVNPVRISEPLESHLNDGQLSSHNWFCGEHQVRGGWTSSGGVSIQSQSIGNGSNADQSLLSVLPSCAQLRSVNPYDPVGPNEQFISPGNFGLMAGGVAPGISNTLPNPTHPLDYLGGRESVMPDDMGWMNLPHQNPALHDPMGKPYLRFWNQ